MDTIGHIFVWLVIGMFLLVIYAKVSGASTGTRTYTATRRLPAWYESPTETIAIRPYASTDLATQDANRAAAHGWTVQSVTTSDGHVNVGRTVTGAVFTGGLSLLAGGSRTRGSVTVTYTRQVPVAEVAAH